MQLRHVFPAALAIAALVLILSGQRGEGQTTNDLPVPLAEAASHVTVPPGFKATLFAGEPDIRQPIAMTFDDRGRLWVAECYTYADLKTNYDLNLRDRIVIFEDSKGTGHFDKQTIFWDQGKRLTSIAVGFGGVFATCAPNLIFIPDRNGDDVADGPPEVLLDGWDTDVVRHNIINGLKWGPDGWLYGRHGILATSLVGKPGTPEKDRTKLNCGIWRYHPTRKIFEVVCQGTTNPWGHDWDEYGNLLFINTVIGHLWQGIPGAYYQRMFGEHLAPHRYGLIEQAADHYHWDTGKSWTESRNAGAGSDALGGGHAHSGLMIYLGDNWPDQCRGHLFTLNFHGRRINEDRLEQNGSGLAGRHEPDFIKFQDPWFRGVDLDYGPDGGVYVLDWSDTGECHGHDGVNRESGRIYKIVYEAGLKPHSRPELLSSPAALLTNSLASFSSRELVQLQYHPNEWYARHARRILQERTESGAEMGSVKTALLRHFDASTNVATKIRLLFALHAVGADSQSWLSNQLQNADFHIRAWAVRFLAESGASWEELVPLFTKAAVEDTSAAVRLELASAMQRIPVELREPLGSALVRHGEDVHDHNLPLMLWYGIEPLVTTYPASAIRLAQQSRIPLVRQYIARRLGEDILAHPEPVNDLLQTIFAVPASAQTETLRGLAEALQDWRHAPQPRGWDALRQALAPSQNAELLAVVRRLGVVFGDVHALADFRRTALDPQAAPDARRTALEQLILSRSADLNGTILKLLEEPVTAGTAARGLLELDDNPASSARVLQHWSTILPEDRPAVVGALSSRPSSAEALLDAIEHGAIPRSAITAYHARQITNLKNEALNKRLTAVWGKVLNSDADKKRQMEHYRELLNTDRLKAADAAAGRVVFTQICAVCHKLYGQGASIGPDLTGSGRSNLDYLLENIVDPSAIVPEDYRVSEVELKDDRTITGLVVGKNEHTIALQTPNEKITVECNEIAKMRQTNLSLMPEGLLQGIKEEQVCNLVKYLMTPAQVPLPQASLK
ncbi:MAG TPA: PVC-type heme-binding CxxCH protein [Patescibacteria group bacterium]|nr:PVC-type heme-binding CxxCH protein [Patescibacteria group bacterium]